MPTTVLSNLERRAIGNLSIPRNVTDLALQLRQDPHAPTKSDQAIAALLDDLKGAGLVVNLGEHEDLAKLAAGLERHKSAVAMPDEKAEIYVDRLKHRARAWRQQGDLWLLTEEGLAQLTAPPVEPDDSELTPQDIAEMTAKLERLIASEYARLAEVDMHGSIFDEDGGRLKTEVPLANAMLSEELAHWVKLVSDAHFERTGVRPRVPIAGGAGYGDATELLILAADTGGTSYGETSPTYVALVTVAVTDADTGSTITEATYSGYARKSVANSDFNSPASGAHTNANPVTFAGASGGSSTVIGFARCVAATVSRLIRYGSCASTIVSATNTPASFAASAYSDTLD